MMMTEKYYTLPPPSPSFSYSTIYHSPTTNRIREIKNRFDLQKKTSRLYEENNMKLLIDQQPTIRTYSLYDVQERIDYFEKKKILDDEIENNFKEKVFSNPSSSSSSGDTLQSVIANTLQQTFFKTESYGSALSRTLMNSATTGKRRSLSSSHIISSNDQKRTNRYYSLLSKRVRAYSLSNHSTMAITATTSFSEEQLTEPHETTSIDYENTYFYPEETTGLDDALSFTTITPNIQRKITNTQFDVSVCSDTNVSQSDIDENSEGITSAVKQYGDTYHINMGSDLQNENIKNNDEQIIRIRLNITPPDRDFTGVVHATKCTIVNEKECLSDYDNVNHYCEQDNKIRSKADNVSLNKSLTSSMQQDHCRRISTDEQLNQQEKRTNHHNDCIKVNQQAIVHSTKMNNDIRMVAQQENDDDDDDDGHYSDESNYSDDLRYSSDAARNSCASDDLNNTSSTLRQEAISITRVRCKRRKTWIRSPNSPTRSPKPSTYLQHRRLKTNLIQPFLSTNQVDGTDARQNASVNSTTAISTILNQTRVKTTTSGMLLHNNSLNCNNNKHKNGETPSYDFISSNNDQHSTKNHESSLLKTSSTFDKDTSSPKSKKKINDFYQPSLSPVKRLLNESIDSNIEIIQMDEQECILEIVDGILTIVPKDKSTSSSSSIGEQQNNNYNKIFQIDSSKNPKQRSSSIASSISTPSLSEQEQERDELSSTSSSKPFALLHDKPSSPPPLPLHLQTEQSVDILDLLSTPIISINSTNKIQKTLLDDSLSSVSSYGERPIESKKQQQQQQQSSIPRSSSPINHKPKSSSIKDTSTSTIENQTRSNKNTLLTQLLETVKKSSPNDEIEIEKAKSDYPIPKPESLPIPKPINKDRINEFASLLSSSVHLSQPQSIKKPLTQKIRSSPTRSDDQSYSSVPSASTDREERESFHTVKSNNSEQDQTKKHIDARYNEKLDDRGSIKIKTANIKALFEQKISDTNKALSQSNEHLLHLTEVKQQQPQQQHKKIPISYGSLKKNLPNYQQTVSNNNNRRKSYQDSLTMNKYTDHIAGTKDVVIEDKQPENGYGNNTRRHTNEQIVRPIVDSLANSPVSVTNGYYSESLIAREIRETKEKEEELKRQRKKCGLTEDESALLSNSINDSIKSESTNQSVKSSSFLSNLDFFTSKLNGSISESTLTVSPRRSIIPTQNPIYDLQSSSSSSSNPSRQTSNDELKQMTNVVSQELNRFNENGVPIIRTSSTNGLLQRSSSNQNILLAQNTNNIIQREIEAIRVKEAELRQLGRIQHTSDEHADPRKYQELVSTLPKSQSINTIPTGKIRRDSENQHISRHNGPIIATTNGFLKPKTNNNNNNNSSILSIRGKFPSPNPTAPVISSSNDYSKLSSTDRLELEKRQCQEREQELRKQRNTISVSISSTNTTINGDSGNVSQEEHDDDQERYFDKIERLKRRENEKAHAPLIRPTKKLDMSQKWEQMMANKIDD